MRQIKSSLAAAAFLLSAGTSIAFEMSAEDWKSRCPAIITADQLKARGIVYLPVERGPAPKYPLDMERAQESGIVTLSLRVDTAGAVVDHQVINATLSGFVDSAVNSARTWRYAPLTIDGGLTCVEPTVEIEFKYH